MPQTSMEVWGLFFSMGVGYPHCVFVLFIKSEFVHDIP